MKAIKKSKKATTNGGKEASKTPAKRWSGHFSNVSTSSDGGTPLTLDGLLEHERAMENSKCSAAYGLARLRRIDPNEWTIADVGVWLDWLHLSEYRAEFMKNAVSGGELKELDSIDLTSLGIQKVRILGGKCDLDTCVADITRRGVFPRLATEKSWKGALKCCNMAWIHLAMTKTMAARLSLPDHLRCTPRTQPARERRRRCHCENLPYFFR